MAKVEKLVRIEKSDKDIKVIAETFPVGRGNRQLIYDVISDMFCGSIRTLTTDVTFNYDENYAVIEEHLDCDCLKRVLTRWGFTVVDKKPESCIKLTLKIPQKISKLKLTIHSISKTENGLPTVSFTDIINYIKEAQLFKLDHYFCVPSMTVKKIMDATLDTISLDNVDFGVISSKRFFSQLERINKILPKLSQSFKGKDVLQFLEKKRELDIVEIYREFYQCETEPLSMTNTGYLLVNSLDIYEQIYRFGSFNKKTAYHYKNFYILKPFRWEHILLISDEYLKTSPASTILSFKSELLFNS